MRQIKIQTDTQKQKADRKGTAKLCEQGYTYDC